jgi:hypothetical protein
LNRKADLSQLLLKADLSELSQLNDLCNQLDRRLQENKLEMNDGLKGLKNNVDKRLEALLQWILKQLKRLADRDSGRGMYIYICRYIYVLYIHRYIYLCLRNIYV